MSITAPVRHRVIEWLAGQVGPAGEVMSWAGGYPYPEVGGLWLTALAAEAGLERQRSEVSRWLVGCVDEEGRVGREGVRYAFDTACARVGLRAVAAGPASLLASMDAALVHDVRARIAAHPPGEARWSTRFSAHMLKLAWALDPEHHPGLLEAASVVQDDDGRIRNRADDAATYVHAACYALEGLLAMRATEAVHARVKPMLERGVAWLARLQAPDGTLPAQLDAQGTPAGRRPSDVIAQSLRLWTRVDPERYAGHRARALVALAERQTPEGAIAYAPDLPHRNTWCSLFTLQALDWQAGARDGRLGMLA